MRTSIAAVVAAAIALFGTPLVASATPSCTSSDIRSATVGTYPSCAACFPVCTNCTYTGQTSYSGSCIGGANCNTRLYIMCLRSYNCPGNTPTTCYALQAICYSDCYKPGDQPVPKAPTGPPACNACSNPNTCNDACPTYIP